MRGYDGSPQEVAGGYLGQVKVRSSWACPENCHVGGSLLLIAGGEDEKKKASRLWK